MSPLPYEIALALRYLRPKRTFVSIITLICVLGVTLGVAVLMIVIAVMTGFGEQLRERILGFNAHIQWRQPANPCPTGARSRRRFPPIPRSGRWPPMSILRY